MNGYSQTIYKKDKHTILADSLHLIGDYKQAISVRKQALKNHINAAKDYQTYLQAKYFHTNSANFEQKSYDYHNPDKTITKKVELFTWEKLDAVKEVKKVFGLK